MRPTPRYATFAKQLDLDAFEAAIGFEPLRQKPNKHGELEDIGHCPDPWQLHKNGDTTGKFAINRDKRVYNCVTGETLVHTASGFFTAASLGRRGAKAPVLGSDGRYHEACWHAFGPQRVYEVEFENGDRIRTTADHRWLVTRQKGEPWNKDRRTWVTTMELEGRRVPLQTPHGFVYDDADWRSGVIHGMCFGDGTLYMEGRYSKLPGYGEEDRELIREFGDPHVSEYNYEPPQTQATRLPARYKALPEVSVGSDVSHYSHSYIRGFIAGLLAADGHVPRNASPLIHQASLDTLEQVRVLAGLVGLPSTSIRRARRLNPWTGEEAPLYCLTFARAGFVNNGEIDEYLILKPSHRSNAIASSRSRTNTHTVKVVAVESRGVEDVFCCIEPVTTTWTTGFGYLTGNCFVCGGGTLLDLASAVNRLTDQQAEEWLVEYTAPTVSDSDFTDAIEAIFEEHRAQQPIMPYYNERVLTPWMAALPRAAGWLAERGISDEVAESHRVGFQADAMRLASPRVGGSRPEPYVGPCVYLPHIWNDRLVGWQQRWLDDDRPRWIPKYTNTSGFPKTETLYNYESVYFSTRPTIVCESVATVLFLESLGYPAVATFGGSVSDEQMRLLKLCQNGIVLAPDNDASGRKWTSYTEEERRTGIRERVLLADYLARQTTVQVMDPVGDYDSGNDLGDLIDLGLPSAAKAVAILYNEASYQT